METDVTQMFGYLDTGTTKPEDNKVISVGLKEKYSITSLLKNVAATQHVSTRNYHGSRFTAEHQRLSVHAALRSSILYANHHAGALHF